MYEDSDARAVELGAYIVNNGATVRAAAAAFGISKSTVHTTVTKRLRNIDRALWLRVRAVLQRNKLERHLRGGYATREKYRLLKIKARSGS